MNIKKKNAVLGKYPSCDMLNNALRFLRDGNTDCAIEEIIFAIEKADGYFHEDNVQMVTDARKKWQKRTSLKGHNMFDKLTAFIGVVFFGGWALAGTFFYVKAFIDFIT